MDSDSWMHQVSLKRFIERCKNQFEWKDLSKDVVMDVGCGGHGCGGKRILELFPNGEAVIGVCKDREEAVNLAQKTTEEIEYVVADIEKRETLHNYEGRITIIVSIHFFHRILKNEEAFRNIYSLLKPGGEVAILFAIKSVTYEWLTEMLMISKWKDAYKGDYVENSYKKVLEAPEYKKLAKNAGFKVVQCLKERRELAYPTDKDCKEALYGIFGKSFNISSELLEEFKEESFQVLLRLSNRNEDGMPCFRFTEVSLLLVKPKNDSDSETN